MQIATSWHIGRDNELKVNPFEYRRLKHKVHLTDRTLHVECPQYSVMDARTAKVIAVMALPNAAIGKCARINVRGPRWHYEFDTKALNSSIRKRWGQREGMAQNPLEQQQAGASFDTTRQLWQVPQSYGKRETIKFPTH